ncbi:hypothetical protein KK062_20915 [Fulvivirgaceae bacterium PWU5]|uniref:RHS repeat-associated core domain-containing protein n=1 Tax=Dawidia cretensis TaxID=2782350 RepID=A0AAP2GVL8_9BACT|nr:DUF6443 domain-containing protein [Dawidia cretensis]MBT1710715.1 hypothetical protein [Dawidia cretensis]
MKLYNSARFVLFSIFLVGSLQNAIARSYTVPLIGSSAAALGATDCPPAPASATDVHMITNASQQVTLSVAMVAGASGYAWYTVPTGGTPLAGVSSNSYTVSLAATTTYYVATLGNVCPSTSRTPVTFYKYPEPYIVATNGGWISPESPTTLSVTDFNGQPVSYDTYQWLDGSGVPIAGATEPTLLVAFPGRFRVRVTKGMSAPVVSQYESPVRLGPRLTDYNHIVINTIQVPGVTDGWPVDRPIEENQVTTQFFDGLGRPMQTVVMQGSPQHQDLVTPVVYDNFGRSTRTYLPTATGNNGYYKANTGLIDAATGNYKDAAGATYGIGSANKIADDNRPFGEVVLESSLLNRPLKEFGPGQEWTANNKFTQYDYRANTVNDNVICWTINASGMPVPRAAPAGPAVYEAAKLHVKVTTDERGNPVQEYTNTDKQLILRRVYAGDLTANPPVVWAETYYIYDDLDLLRYVLPPELVSQLTGTTTQAPTTTQLANWAFQYRYDTRKRMTQKQVPGAEPVYMVYDLRDRLVLTQDGVQRAGNYWSFTKYDMLDRPILTGVKDTTTAVSQELMQSSVNTHYYKSWTRLGESFVGYEQDNIHGYSNRSYPVCTSGALVDENHYLTVTYYDNYIFIPAWLQTTYQYESAGLTQPVSYGGPYTSPASAFGKVLGQVTGMKTKVLDEGVRGGYMWLRTVTYYDKQYRAVQTVADNFKGGVDRQSMLYSFTGQVLQSRLVHSERDVAWTGFVGTRVIGNKLYRNIGNNSRGQAGAVSRQILPAGQDGWLEFTASEQNKSRMLGFSDQNLDADYTSLDYAFYLRDDGVLQVREDGGKEKPSTGANMWTYKPGDVLRIARIGTAVKYYKNGAEIYPAEMSVTQTSSTTPLMVDVAFSQSQGSLVGVRSSFSGSTHTVGRRFVYDHTGRLTETYHTLGRSATWKDRVGTAVLSDGLTKTLTTSSWDAGAVSNESIPANTDGWIEFRAVERNVARMVGFTDQNTTANYSDMDYAVYLRNNGVLWIYESGQDKGVSLSYAVNDILRIERKNGTVYYKLNGETIYTSATSSANELRADCSIYTPGAKIAYVFMGTSPGTSEVLLTRNTYNEVGQLIGKDLHSANGATAQQSIDYRYNIRGWMTSINNASLTNDGAMNEDVAGNGDKDYFGMNLLYNTVDAGLGNTAQYDGNITGMTWSHNQGLGAIKQNGYVYGYDAMNRIQSSQFKQRNATTWSALANNGFAETGFRYDLNGNLLNLTRNDNRVTGLTMDVLNYDYGTGTTRSNKLLKVIDTGDKATGFVDGANTSNDYNYDANGNMLHDLNKGIGFSLTDPANMISYNILNLPQVVTKGDNSIRYIYDAAGRKLSQQVGFAYGMKKTDYTGDFVYENDVLQFVHHEEGRAVIANSELVYANTCDVVSPDVTAKDVTISAVTIGTEKYIKAKTNAAARAGIFPIGSGVNVLPGERYKIRAKVYWTKGTATSNHPANILVTLNGNDMVWPGALIPLSSTIRTESWIEQIVTIPSSAPADALLEVGIVANGTTFAGEELYLNEFEIARLADDIPEYQYFMKDHLGNVRLTFTTKHESDTDIATMEDAAADQERTQFIDYDEAVTVNETIFDHTHINNSAQSTFRSVRLTGGANDTYGLAKSVSVMPGDVIEAEVWGKYVDPDNTTPELQGILTSMIPGSGAGGAVVDGGTAVTLGASAFPFVALISRSGDTGSGPRAYLNYLLFDRNDQIISQGYRRMTTAAREDGATGSHERLQFAGSNKIAITEPGYIYFFFSYEPNGVTGDIMTEVYFDDFKVTHTKSPVIETDDYYPFGLTFNSYQRQNSIHNRWKFQGQEHIDDLNLGWDSFKWRNHQPEIGRFFNVDLLSEKYYFNSPYAFSENKVVADVELEGLESVKAKTVYTNNANGTITATSSTIATTEKLQATVAITSGTVMVSGKMAGIEVGAGIKTEETDLIGFRDNGFVFGGYNESGDYVDRTGASGGVGLFSLGTEGTRINGVGTSSDVSFSVGGLKNTVTTDAATGTQTYQQSFDIGGLTLGIGVVGVDIGLSYKTEQTVTQTTTTYKGDMGIKPSGGSSTSKPATAPKLTWHYVPGVDASKIKEIIK